MAFFNMLGSTLHRASPRTPMSHPWLAGQFIAPLVLILFSMSAVAQVIVAPTALTSIEGNHRYLYNSFPLTFQQLFGPTQLVGLSIGDQVTAMQFRLDGGETSGPDLPITTSDFDVYLGPSNFAPGALTNNVAANQGLGTMSVRAGPLTFPANSFPGGAGPNDFGFLITFASPYVYTGGNLLLTVSYSSPSGNLNWDSGTGLSDVHYRQSAGYNNPVIDNDFPTNALVTQFTFTQAPEPASLLLTAIGAGIWTVVQRVRYPRMGKL